jgi:hypothetical protein
MFFIFRITIILLSIAYLRANLKIKRDVLGKCVSESSCKLDEYCDKDFPNPFGVCKEGLKVGDFCLKDSRCSTKRCNYFRCKERLTLRDGPCKVHQDCPADQFCNKIEDTDGLKKCVNRKCKGVCKTNAECLSNKCHLFICVNQDSSKCS